MPHEAETMRDALSRLLTDQSRVDAVLAAIERDEERLVKILSRAQSEFGLVVPANASGVDRILPLYDFAEAIGAIDRSEVDYVPLVALLDRIEQRLLTQVSVERFQQKVKEQAEVIDSAQAPQARALQFMPSGDGKDLIPNEYRTIPLSKTQAIKHLGRFVPEAYRGLKRKSEEWLNECIDADPPEIRWEFLNRSKGYYHIEDFPEEARDKIRGFSN
ncbi:hypothetical protein [Rhodopirellula baltica]|nr:hypothetical protein [Rhodopirellula baltica]